MRHPHEIAWRLYTQLLAVAIATVMTVSTAVAAGFDRPNALAAPRSGVSTLVDLPAGQQTTDGLLPASATAFPTAATGWSPEGARLGWTKKSGHAAKGALTVAARAGADGGQANAISPTFPVTEGVRYAATAWIKGGTASTGDIAPALEFMDVTGRVMGSATQIGQRIADSAKWHALMPVVGFAPPLATTARMVLVVHGTATRNVDDVSVTKTTGKPAALAGPLTTRGRDIVDAQGRRVVLRGVEIDGLQTPDRVPVTTMMTEIKVARDWGANSIRLPLDQDRLVGGSCSADSSYLSTIRQLVAEATSLGMLVELDLHTFAVIPCTDPRIEPMPNAQSVAFWQTLATAFANQPLVAFDLFNEPHYTDHKVWRDGGVVHFAGLSYRAVGMQKIYDTVRAAGAENLVLVSGPDYATQPWTYPLAGLRNAVAAVHFYTCPTGPPSKKTKCFSPGPSGYTDPAKIFSIWRKVTDLPLVMNEYGWPQNFDGRYDAAVITTSEKRRWAGWIAFTFDGSTAGLFSLPRNTGPLEDPSPRGMAVMIGLARN